jgi:hypothetical protein
MSDKRPSISAILRSDELEIFPATTRWLCLLKLHTKKFKNVGKRDFGVAQLGIPTNYSCRYELIAQNYQPCNNKDKQSYRPDLLTGMRRHHRV